MSENPLQSFAHQGTSTVIYLASLSSSYCASSEGSGEEIEKTVIRETIKGCIVHSWKFVLDIIIWGLLNKGVKSFDYFFKHYFGLPLWLR